MAIHEFSVWWEIRKGDRVLFHGEPGEIEFVADRLVGDPVVAWNVKENDPGCYDSRAQFFLGVHLCGIQRTPRI
jgi:hypothetical protein